MTLPVSGAISFNDINVELGVAGATQASLGQASYRTLAGVPSGAISMSDFYGKANEFSFSIASDTANVDLRAAALAAGWNETIKVKCTINSGVIVYSTSTGSYAMTISGSFPGGVELVNSGTILGRGGNGGNGGQGSSGNAGNNGASGTAAGPALFVSTAVSINNVNRIAGGGGGGGGGGAQGGGGCCGISGGGGGGGIGTSAGGSGSTVTGGCSGLVARSQDGGGGSLTSNGGGGSGSANGPFTAGTGGSGGGYGSSGSNGGGGSGGSEESCGSGTAYSGGSGGAAGAAVVGDSNITWIATGTRNGNIS
jgi:hypothetical protein